MKASNIFIPALGCLNFIKASPLTAEQKKFCGDFPKFIQKAQDYVFDTSNSPMGSEEQVIFNANFAFFAKASYVPIGLHKVKGVKVEHRAGYQAVVLSFEIPRIGEHGTLYKHALVDPFEASEYAETDPFGIAELEAAFYVHQTHPILHAIKSAGPGGSDLDVGFCSSSWERFRFKGILYGSIYFFKGKNPTPTIIFDLSHFLKKLLVKGEDLFEVRRIRRKDRDLRLYDGAGRKILIAEANAGVPPTHFQCLDDAARVSSLSATVFDFKVDPRQIHKP